MSYRLSLLVALIFGLAAASIPVFASTHEH